jgi:hypothetical protein
VLSPSTGTTASRAAEELLYLRAFGRRYFNPRTFISNEASFDELSLTPTAQDLIDIADGRIPESFRTFQPPPNETLRDSTHYNDYGYTLLGNGVYDRMLELEYLS